MGENVVAVSGTPGNIQLQRRVNNTTSLLAHLQTLHPDHRGQSRNKSGAPDATKPGSAGLCSGQVKAQTTQQRLRAASSAQA